MKSYKKMIQGLKWGKKPKSERRLNVKINSPVSFLIAVGCFGYVLGDFREILKLISTSLDKKAFSMNGIDFIYFALLIIVFTIGSCTLIYSFLYKNDAKRILEEIRSRRLKDIKNSEP